ncbi:MAG: 2-dehydropantoate 2-reductase [Verrucomicrobiota bacterium]|mgnify:FL=1|nr:2-dehydropantoate 2-reductase [Verrucomicrobiota bacterium]MDP6251455.1 2-dehydropantoate 2-reductase [Verrucomicrobiota bacterium]MDP7177043.1 2-dehydropantoate 2-reductase [Verrucomicrobiota bacterium]MDP7291081.1 2-dehydropantoate 2-reductase [Verrucomicrobiota bacterium]
MTGWTIGVVGCGAVGGFYGAKLCQTGCDVHFLLRSDYEAVRENGVRIRTADGDFDANPTAARSPGEIGLCDLVIVALKSTANHHLGKLLPPLVGEHTALLTLQNGLGNEIALAALFPDRPILGGMCFVCLNRIEPGVIHHIAHGKIVLGRHGGPPDDLTGAVAKLIRSTGIPVDVSPDLERAHWEKLIWNIPFNGLSVAGAAGLAATLAGRLDHGQPIGPCLATDALLDNGPWEQLVTELMDEVIRTGRALGHDLSPGLGEHQRNRTRVMKAYLASTPIDFVRGLPLELDALFRLPLGQAQAAGVETPRLVALCDLLAQLDDLRKDSGSDAA